MDVQPFAPPLCSGKLIPRPPVAQELARRGSCRLGRRDLEIVTAVSTHGLLTADLLNVAFFWLPGNPSVHPGSHAYERLRQLWLWGLLDRYDPPAPRGVLGSMPALYALGQRGMTVVAQRVDPQLRWPGHAWAERGTVGLEHELTVAAVWAHLQALVRLGRLAGCQWTPERVLRARQVRVLDPASGRRLPVLLDGLADVEAPDGTLRQLLVEVDRGTLTVERFRRKLRAWELYAAAGGGDDRGNTAAATVLVLAPSWPRLSNLWQAGRMEVAAPRHSRYRFATLDVLHPNHFGDDGAWLTLGGEYLGLLAEQRASEPVRKGDDHADGNPGAG